MALEVHQELVQDKLVVRIEIDSDDYHAYAYLTKSEVWDLIENLVSIVTAVPKMEPFKPIANSRISG